MSTFDTIIWWYGVVLFTIAVTFFYGTLAYCIGKGIWDYFKK